MAIVRLHPLGRVASPGSGRPVFRLVSAREFLSGLAALSGSRESGSSARGIAVARLVNGVEYAQASRGDDRSLRSSWTARRKGGPTPLVLVADDPDDAGMLRVLGPQEGGPIRRIRAESLLDLVRRTTAMGRLEAVRHVAGEVERLDAEGVAGLTVRGLGTEHLFDHRLPADPRRWSLLTELSAGLAGLGWRDALTRLGYGLEPLAGYGYLVRLGARAVAVVHPKESPSQFARLDAEGRLPEGALLAACREQGVDFGLMVAGTRVRLLATGSQEAGATSRYLDLDTSALEPGAQPLLGLLAPTFLAEGGLSDLLAEARDYGQELRKRLDRVLRQDVLPVLGVELGRWAEGEGRDLADDAVREDLESAALTFVFRALFLLYAESAGHLPIQNQTYRERSMTAICRRAAEEVDRADARSTSLWRDIGGLVEAMRTGQRAWGVPAYNGDLFSPTGFAGAGTLASAAIADAALAPALVALARDPDDPDIGVDFSGLEVGHLGHIYEGLLSLRLSLADRDYAYDERADRYASADPDTADVKAGELLWLTNEGGRKGGGVYYTRTELVRHLVRGAVGPAFDRHLEVVRQLADTDPTAAAEKLFEFYVLDPACGSAHFLVEVLDELADKIAAFLGEIALPGVREALEGLRLGAGPTYGAGVEDTALLKRLVLKRCVYGVDLSPMGAEIAKVSLWLGSFVPGLSLAYLDHNVQVGNSLIGVVRPEQVARADGQATLFDQDISDALQGAAQAAAELRAIEDRTPEEVEESKRADAELRSTVLGVERVFDLWTAEPLGLPGAREEALQRGSAIIAEQDSLVADTAGDIASRERVLHWPLAFAEVFARPNPGFDAVVGNPPWEEITVEELAFYARYRPGLRAMAEAPRIAALATLIEERPELVVGLTAEQARVAAQRTYFGAAGGYEGGAGDPDTYKYFCQRYRELLRDGAALGVVLPRSAFSAKGSYSFRRWLFERAAPRRIDFLLNNRSWAFDIHPQYSVGLLVAERRKPAGGELVEVAGVASSSATFMEQVAGPGLLLPRDALGPNLEVPLLPTQAAADVLAKTRRGTPFPLGGGRWTCFPVAEFHETNDRKLWEGSLAGAPLPLWQGRSFDQFSPSGAGARTCPESPEALKKARKPRPGAQSAAASVASLEARRAAVARAVGRARPAFRDVTRATDSRTVRAALIPPRVFLTNKAPYLAFVANDPRSEAACLGILNSLPFDWQSRRFVEINLNFFILEGLRIPNLDDATFDAVAQAAARLSCPDERFADFADATGVKYGPIEPDEREGLRAEIDAQVARAWHLTSDDIEVIFTDFTLDAVPEIYRQRVRARFAELAS